MQQGRVSRLSLPFKVLSWALKQHHAWSPHASWWNGLTRCRLSPTALGHMCDIKAKNINLVTEPITHNCYNYVVTWVLHWFRDSKAERVLSSTCPVEGSSVVCMQDHASPSDRVQTIRFSHCQINIVSEIQFNCQSHVCSATPIRAHTQVSVFSI